MPLETPNALARGLKLTFRRKKRSSGMQKEEPATPQTESLGERPAENTGNETEQQHEKDPVVEVEEHEARVEKLLSDDVSEEVHRQRGGARLDFDGSVIAQVACLVTDALCETWPQDLLRFAKHGRRSIVSANDVKLMLRKNESLVRIVDEELANPPTSRRKSSGRSRGGAVPEGGSDTPQPRKGTSSRRGAPQKLSRQSSDLNVSRITDFLTNVPQLMPGPSRVSVTPTDSDEKRCSRASSNTHSLSSADRRNGRNTTTNQEVQNASSVNRLPGIPEGSPLSEVDSVEFDDVDNDLNMERGVIAEAVDEYTILKDKPKMHEKNADDEIAWEAPSKNGRGGTGRKPTAKRKAERDRPRIDRKRAAKEGERLEVVAPSSSGLEQSERQKETISDSEAQNDDDTNAIQVVFSSFADNKPKPAKETVKVVKTIGKKARKGARGGKVPGLERFVRRDVNGGGVDSRAVGKNANNEPTNRSKGSDEKVNMKSSAHRVVLDSVLSRSSNPPSIPKDTTGSGLSPEPTKPQPFASFHSGGSSRDLFASPSPTKRSPKPLRAHDKAVVGASRNLMGTLHHQLEHSTMVDRRWSTASRDSVGSDSSSWDMIDTDMTVDEAKAIVGEHAQPPSHGGTTNPNRTESSSCDIRQGSTANVAKPSNSRWENAKTTNYVDDFEDDDEFDLAAVDAVDGVTGRQEGAATNQHNDRPNNAQHNQRFSTFTFESDDEGSEGEAQTGRGVVDVAALPAKSPLTESAPESNNFSTQQEESKSQRVKAFSAFSFESDEENEGTKRGETELGANNRSSGGPLNREQSSAESTVRPSERASTTNAFTTFNFESDDEVEENSTISTRCSDSRAAPSNVAALHADDSFDEDLDLDATIFD